MGESMQMPSLNKKKYYIVFTLYFIGFGIIVALLTSYVNYKASFTDVDNKLKEMVNSEAEFKREIIFNYIANIEMLLSSIVRNDLTIKYVKSNEINDKQNLNDLFYALAYANKDIMQLRYLDASGKEVIRIDRDKKTPELIIVPDGKLQDKSQRYYFRETSLLMANQFWHSNIDLNMERGEIERPIKPTFRVATQLVVENEFKGIVIVNLLFDNAIKILANSSNFDIHIIDKEGEIIHHPDGSGSWSKYLDNLKTLHDYYPAIIKKIIMNDIFIHEGVYSFSYGDLFRNNENMKLVFSAKKDIMEKMHNSNILSAMLIALTVLLVSVPLSWVVSIIPSQLQSKLATAYDKIKKNADIIDKYVMISSTDQRGLIKEISTKFTKMTGYTPDEVVGKPHNILKHPDTSPEVHADIWNSILNGRVWEGELQDQDKNGNAFWINNVISPELDDEGQIAGFTAIAQDITDKKIIEKMSITDSLTGLYNRHKLEEVLLTEKARFDRYGSHYSIILMDIDFFKKVNDSFGHQAGDNVLVHLAKILKKNARETDFISRWGGEEFLIVVGNSDIDSTMTFADKLRMIIAKHRFPLVDRVTISCGVAQYIKGETVDKHVSRADDALYKAKETGRNKVVEG